MYNPVIRQGQHLFLKSIPKVDICPGLTYNDGMKPTELQQILTETHLSQAKLGRLIGVSRQSVNNWVMGRKTMSEPYQILCKLIKLRPELIDVLEGIRR